MAKQGKPEGNKRQRERDKRRKKEEKAARRLANTGGQSAPGILSADSEAIATDSPVERDGNEGEPTLPSESAETDVKRAP